jgi:AraC-like DNA-binding protein
VAVLACLQMDPRASARIVEVLGEEHILLACPGWERLWEVLRTHRVDGCILDLERTDRDEALRDLQQLRLEHHGLALVVYTDFAGRELDLFRLGRLGVDAVLLAGSDDDAAAIRRATDTALASALANSITTRLEGRIDPLGVLAVRWAVENARESPNVAGLAAGVGLSVRLLNDRLRERGLPSAAQLLLWGRLLRAAGMMGGSGVRMESVAWKLGYSSASALRRALRRHTGLAGGELASSQSVDFLLESLVERCTLRRRQRVRSTAASPVLGPG